MTAIPLSVLWVGAPPPAAGLGEAAGLRASQAADEQSARQHDAVVYTAEGPAGLAALATRAALAHTAFETAVLVLAHGCDDAAEQTLLALGVQAIVEAGHGDRLAREIRHAVARKKAERAARHAYATDLATGLPHRAQLVEHMTQLLALREREPAPMVLIVLRIEGYALIARQLGVEAANILRRKVAVRLRGLLRASDVVAALGPDDFGVLLGRLENKGDGQRVAAKLVRALQLPLPVAGQPCSVVASVGLALYPDHGKDAASLLQRAGAQAGSLAVAGEDGGPGPAGPLQPPGGTAANDATAS